MVELGVALWKIGNCTSSLFIHSNEKAPSGPQQITKRGSVIENMDKYLV